MVEEADKNKVANEFAEVADIADETENQTSRGAGSRGIPARISMYKGSKAILSS